MKNKKATIVTLILVSSLALVARSNDHVADSTKQSAEYTALVESEQETITYTQIAAEIQSKYADQEMMSYTEPVYNVERNHTFTYEVFYDPMEVGYTSFTELVGFYADADFTKEVYAGFEAEENGQGGYRITCKPGRSGAAQISTQMNDGGTFRKLGEGHYLFDQGEYSNWGNLSEYYMVQWVDHKTGEALSQPIVTVFTVKAELESPQTYFYITEDGSPIFQWNEVEGAKEYYILQIDCYKNNMGSATVIGRTTDTSWEYDNEGAVDFMNNLFHSYTGSVDHQYYYGVVAVNEQGTSTVDQLYSETNFTYRLPYCINQSKMWEGNQSLITADSIELLPVRIPLIMADNSEVVRMVNYNVEEAKLITKSVVQFNGDINEDPEVVETIQVPAVIIPYSVEGTLFTGEYSIYNFDQENYQQELADLKNRQDALSVTGSNQDGRGVSSGEDKADESQESSLRNDYLQNSIFATNALSEYLAINMLARNEKIDVSEFKESSNQTLLKDCFYEAINQNPLILSVIDSKISTDGKYLHVTYGEEPEAMLVKQNEIIDEVKLVVSQLITDGMSDIEKEIAINDYLCNSAEYDNEALVDAQSKAYKASDPKFNDSFTPYGILLNKKGVCSSYAGAFKLLAEEAGLEVVVVTGHLEGVTPHAWNRVKLEGEWVTVDSTNNDSEFMKNALLNLPDYAAKPLLVEDGLYLMDSYLGDYTAQLDDQEYYRYTDRFYVTDEIIHKFVELLQEMPRVTLRTDYNLNESVYMEIVSKVNQELVDRNVTGFYFMGVITLGS